MPLRAPQWFNFLVRWFRFWHKHPSKKNRTRRYAGNAEKPNRTTEVSKDKAKECCAERRATTRERSNETLGQIESASALREIRNN
jgi:hypothetical protein